MSARYLLTCPACEKQIPVEAGRAGGTTTCSCGASVDVPTVRVLRTLPQETVAVTSTGDKPDVPQSTWGQKQGVMLLGLLLILAGGVPAAYKWVTFPKPPFRTQDEIRDVADIQFEKMSLSDTWQFWKTYIEPQGLTREPTIYEAAYVRQSADIQQWIFLYCGVAAVGVILLLAGMFLRSDKPLAG